MVETINVGSFYHCVDTIEDMRQEIWRCLLPTKKGQWDNDYVFYNDRTIVHEYDLSVKKFNLKEDIMPADIPEKDMLTILNKVDSECPREYVDMVKDLLTM